MPPKTEPAVWRLLSFLTGRLGSSSSQYVEEREKAPEFAKITSAIKDLETRLTREAARLVADVVKDLAASESAREAAIQSRAQGLLVGQAFITSLLTLGAGATGGKGAFQGLWAYGIIFLGVIIVFAGLVLTWNALQALSGQSYPRLGFSDVSRAIAAEGARAPNAKVPSFQARVAVQAFNIYRQSVIRNDWRFIFLARAQRSLWVSMYALAALVLAVFGSVFSPWSLGSSPSPYLPGVPIPEFSLPPLPLNPGSLFKLPPAPDYQP